LEEWQKEFYSDHTPSELDLLQKKLMKAVKLEDYESAAVIRDDIFKIKISHNKKIIPDK